MKRWERRVLSLLQASYATGSDEWYALDLAKALAVGPARLYPALTGLERQGLIVHRVEPGPEPRRTLYCWTGKPA